MSEGGGVMKETMAEEMTVSVVREELINDNALLRFVYDNPRDKENFCCTIYVRYIQDKAIHETKIGCITLVGSLEQQQDDGMCIYGSNNSLLEYNQKGIAYFSYYEDGSLFYSRVFDFRNYRFVDKEYEMGIYQRLFSSRQIPAVQKRKI